MSQSTKWIVAMAVIVAIARFADAQAVSEVSGSGSSTIMKMPQSMRLQAEFTIDAADIRDAVTKLNEKRASVRKTLTDLGASEGSIQFLNLRMRTAAERAAEAARMAQMGVPRQPAAATTQPARGVTLSCMFKADWPMKATTEADLLMEAVSIQDMVRAANLTGASGPSRLFPAEEEERREAEMIARLGGNVPQPTLTFIFLAKLTPEERIKAAAEAFAKAKEQAAVLAKAAGSELGVVRQLNSRIGASENYPMSDYEVYRYGYAVRQMVQQQTGPDEAIGLQPEAVSAQIIVQASFMLK